MPVNRRFSTSRIRPQDSGAQARCMDALDRKAPWPEQVACSVADLAIRELFWNLGQRPGTMEIARQLRNGISACVTPATAADHVAELARACVEEAHSADRNTTRNFEVRYWWLARNRGKDPYGSAQYTGSKNVVFFSFQPFISSDCAFLGS